MGNTSSRPLINPRAPPDIYHDLGYGAIISNPLRAPLVPEAPPNMRSRRTISSARKPTTVTRDRGRVIGGYPKQYHW